MVNIMKRIILIFLILLLLSGCKHFGNTFTPPEDPVIISPDSSAEETADGYRKIPSETEIVYYANKESKKIHLPSCRYAKAMLETKIRLEKDYEVLILDGYTPCGVCRPESKE